MYQSHWGLEKTPFRGCLDPDFFFESPTHEEALARLHFLVEQRRRLGLLIGTSGSGKSLLLEVFAQQLRRGGLPVAKLSVLGLEPVDTLSQIAAGFELNPDPGDSVARLWRMVTDRLSEFRYQQLDATLLLDDADRASKPVLDMITRLAQHDSSPESRLTIVLAGQRERLGRLGDRLLGLAELRIDIEPWEATDTEDYLKSSLARAGCETPIFDPPAVARLHELTHGIPRHIGQLADLALLAGAGEELKQINAKVVESVYQELGVG
ncbi:MAG: AAA family ATPase [Thermoguttaceae bacterium]